ncbi:Unknown protein sequence [Pseudomonas amygdali pv. lachrymans]|nr:Unknown protein sequence [Pseudomonas amygdali pv. lachrymans]
MLSEQSFKSEGGVIPSGSSFALALFKAADQVLLTCIV